MYKVYRTDTNKYRVTFADAQLCTIAISLTNAFENIRKGEAFPVSATKESVLTTYLFTCKSLTDAQARYPELFI